MLRKTMFLPAEFDFHFPTDLSEITPEFLIAAAIVVAVIVVLIVLTVTLSGKRKKKRKLDSSNEKPKDDSAYTQPFFDSQPLGTKSVNYENDVIGNEADKTEEQYSESMEYAIKSDISYTASFDPIKVEDLKPTKAPRSGKKLPPVKVEDGYAVITSEHRQKLEKAYSYALKKCAITGTSEELQELLDAKKYMTMDRIPRDEFKRLLDLLMQKR